MPIGSIPGTLQGSYNNTTSDIAPANFNVDNAVRDPGHSGMDEKKPDTGTEIKREAIAVGATANVVAEGSKLLGEKLSEGTQDAIKVGQKTVGAGRQATYVAISATQLPGKIEAGVESARKIASGDGEMKDGYVVGDAALTSGVTLLAGRNLINDGKGLAVAFNSADGTAFQRLQAAGKAITLSGDDLVKTALENGDKTSTALLEAERAGQTVVLKTDTLKALADAGHEGAGELLAAANKAGVDSISMKAKDVAAFAKAGGTNAARVLTAAGGATDNATSMMDEGTKQLVEKIKKAAIENDEVALKPLLEQLAKSGSGRVARVALSAIPVVAQVVNYGFLAMDSARLGEQLANDPMSLKTAALGVAVVGDALGMSSGLTGAAGGALSVGGGIAAANL